MTHALRIEPERVEARYGRATALLAAGAFDRAWPDFEARWSLPGAPPRAYLPGVPYWTGTEPLAGKRILLFDEQGFGDAIQFARYASLLCARAREVILECRPELSALFTGLCNAPTVRVRGATHPTDIDLQTSLMSLPLALGAPFDPAAHAAPYLTAPAHAVQAWRTKLADAGRAPRVGITWTGDPSFYGAREKSCPAGLLATQLAHCRCTFVNLQLRADAADLSALGSRGMSFVDWTEALHSFADTAALIDSLDLVITIDTAVAHLAGALGKPVWIMLPFSADWRWMTDATRSPWYPSMRLYRQRRPGDWEDVVQRVRDDLASEAAKY